MKLYLLYKHGEHITLRDMKRARQRFSEFARHYAELAWEEWATDGTDTFMAGVTDENGEDIHRTGLPRTGTAIGQGIDLNRCTVDRRFFEDGQT